MRIPAGVFDPIKHLAARTEGMSDQGKDLVHFYLVGAASHYVPEIAWTYAIDRAISLAKGVGGAQ